MTCGKKVIAWIRMQGELSSVEITVSCGDLFFSGTDTKVALCPACREEAHTAYPQGWYYKPGDTCKHGVYIAGDRDCACPKCESE